MNHFFSDEYEEQTIAFSDVVGNLGRKTFPMSSVDKVENGVVFLTVCERHYAVPVSKIVYIDAIQRPKPPVNKGGRPRKG